VQIPREYGFDQAIGDTLGSGRVFRFLRSARAYREIADDMRRLCQARCSWIMQRRGEGYTGLAFERQTELE
jgi:alpha-galactosidase/6-phospho-beta-glucosidase family protein